MRGGLAALSGRFALTGVAAAALGVVVPSASALGLGRMQVQSALGEALRAEIDVTSLTPEEASNLRVRVATPDAYKAAGVDYNAVLPGTQVELLRRPDGRPYLRLSSNRGVQEPFVDVILEMNWASGRLVREYTMLFDPPTTARAPAAPPVVAAVVPPAPAARPVETRAVPVPAAPPMQTAVAPSPAPAAAPRPTAAEPPTPTRRVAASTPVAVAPAPGGAGDAYRVRPGDSLSRIATRTQRPGVSLDQMLVSLYRSNPQAFIDSNMNRLRSGVVLSVPSAEAVKSVGPDEAHQVIQAQSADFGAYRQRLAGMVPATRPEGSARQASGKVQAQVDERANAGATAPDRLTLSSGRSASSAAAAEEQARNRRADEQRAAELARNVEELKRVASAASAAASRAPAPTVVAVAPPPPAPAPASASAAPATPAPAPAAPVIAASAATPPPATAAASTPAAPAPVVATASSSAPARSTTSTNAEEPGMFGSMLEENPLLLGLGGVALAALLGFGLWRLTRRSRTDGNETSFLESRLQPDSFFGASGGQRIDTRDGAGTSTSMSYSLSQLDAIGDVDPVAEADVYLAYGRDLQAEEILKEAMRSNPDRLAVRTKLLEVYAKRRDTKGFELLATQLYALTRGTGEDWSRAQELGGQIDPDNPLYRPGGAPAGAAGPAGDIVEPLGASTLPQSVLPSPSKFTGSGGDSRPMDLDLDLDLDAPESEAPAAYASTSAAFAPTTAAPEPTVVQSLTPSPVADEDPMSIDFSLPEATNPTSRPSAAPHAAPTPQPSAFDLGDLSLDLDLPETGAPAPAPATTGSVSGNSRFGESSLSFGDEADDPLSRKLELADEFRQIGDTDGARDLLREVVAESTGAVQRRAQSMLADLE